MNIVLIVLDTARGDITNSLIQQGELPNLTKLAAGGQYYTNAQANAPWTVLSHGAIFTGEYPVDSGITGDDPTYDTVPLVDKLQSQGFTTAGFSGNPWLTSNFNFDSSFDTFQNMYDYYPTGASMSAAIGDFDGLIPRIRSFIKVMNGSAVPQSIGNVVFWAYQYMFRVDSGGKHLLTKAGDWLQNSSKSPKFTFVNVTEPHLPYEIPDSWLPNSVTRAQLDSIGQDTTKYNAGISNLLPKEANILEEVYKSTLKYIDHQIGKLVAKASENTAFVVVGDHGEHFGEYGRFGHQYSLHRELLHVPLVISGPSVERAQIDEMVELRSLYKVIQSLAKGETVTLPEVDEHIAELVTPRPSIERLQSKPFANLRDYVYQYGSGARCIVKDGSRLIEFPNGETELIKERENTAETEESLYSALHQTRGKIEFGEAVNLDVSKHVESQLKDLGYA